MRLTQFSKGGGCGCKIAPSVLKQILETGNKDPFPDLLVGNDTSDDAAVYKINDTHAIISTTDFFLPIVDDAFDFGSIASANAISDVYAMGGTPMMAVALLGWPVEKLNVAEARRVLEGARKICREANIPLAGGHTIDSNDPIFGLAVTGRVELSRLKKNSTAKEGDLLFLTKPIGVGIMATALKKGVLDAAHYNALLQQLTTLNKIGEPLAALGGVHAMTDVTGFGLLGHLIEMADGSSLGAELYYNRIVKVEALDEYLRQRTIPDATFRNWNSYSARVQFEKGVNVMEAFNLLPDPQTNGGILFAADPSCEAAVVQLLKESELTEHVHPIGRFIAAGEKTIIVSSGEQS